MQKVLIIALKYQEETYSQTLNSINALTEHNVEFKLVFADRDGVGNYSRAFNEAFKRYDLSHRGVDIFNTGIERIDYVWLVSNVTFTCKSFLCLIETMKNAESNFCAIHPVMDTSDHVHQHYTETPLHLIECPKNSYYIEMTAPLIRYSVFKNYMLDEKLPYWYMDLDWSYRVRQAGLRLGVCNIAQVNHVYLRNNKREFISKIRDRLRIHHKPAMVNHMVSKYGLNWKRIMGWNE